MSYKPFSNFLEETRGVGDVPPLSERELSLLSFALDSFGDTLGGFLFSGLGEDKTTPGWLFVVTFPDGLGRHRSREVRVWADYRPDLTPSVPQNKEPLVALALLRLLIVDRRLSLPGLPYSEGEVLGLLGWEDTHESRRKVDEAVKRYTSLSYEWSASEGELAETKLSFFHGETRFITWYGRQSVEEDGEVRRTANQVSFDEEFVKELVERSLFGIDWDSVSSVERIPCDAREDGKVRW